MDINWSKNIETLKLVTERDLLGDKKDFSYEIKPIKKEKAEIKPRDPRKNLFIIARKDEVELIIPQFIYDKNSIGEPPEKEVTFSNLNDNINKKNLDDMCRCCGSIEEIKILYHPKTNRHLGLAKVVFRSSRSAKTCVEKYHNTSKMGNIMTVQIDVLGKLRNEMYNNLVNPPVVSQSELDANLKPLPRGCYQHEQAPNNFVISSDDVVKSAQPQTRLTSTVKSESVTEIPVSNQIPIEIDSESENCSDDSAGQNYIHGNSVVSSSLDPSRMVASSLTNEPLEPLEIRIAKLLTGTSVCTESQPPQPPVNNNSNNNDNNNDISSSTEPFHYEEAYPQSMSYGNSTNGKSDTTRRYPNDKSSSGEVVVNYKSSEDSRHNRSRNSSKSSSSYHTNQRVLILKTPPKKMTNREIKEMLDKLKNQFIDDLKETLHRDICKKMIETTAYGSFHNWWDFKEHEHKSAVGDKLDMTDLANGNSLQRMSLNTPDNVLIRQGEKSNVFQSQMNNYTGLPKIKRVACPLSLIHI